MISALMTNLALCQSHAESLIANALLEYSPNNLVLSYNGGKDCTVLLDLVARIWRRFPEFSSMKLKTVYVSEKDPFPELEHFIQTSTEKYPFIELYSYNMSLKEAFTEFSNNNNLKNYAILIGVRRTDPFCENLHEVHASDNGWPKFIRINLILNWSYSLIWVYIDKYEIDYCTLYCEGYTSLGSRPKTQPNPKLMTENGNFLHARALKYATFERIGRS